MRECTEAQFLKDVANHQMTIALNGDVYRHVRFKQPGTSNMWFDLVTWPEFLTISGDMGCWTFSRVPDMFTFFRDTEKLRINPSYWAEKLQHGNYSGREGGKVWDEDAFKKSLLDILKNHYDFKGKKLKEITEAVKEEVFSRSDDGKHAMLTAAYEFTYEFEANREAREKREEALPYRARFESREKATQFQFDAMDLPDGMVYSYRFIWCLYAIVWGIQRYDNAAKPAEISIAS